MRRFPVYAAVLLFAACVSLAGGARGDETSGSLILSNCGTSGTNCPAATYNFDVTNTSATLTIDITGTPNSSNDYITAVDLGFSSSGTITGLSLVAAPGNLSDWTDSTGSLNSGGSCGINSGAFLCSSASPLDSLQISQNGQYSWTWDFDPISSIDSSVHVGAEYGPNSNLSYNGLIVSQTVQTPEPSEAALLGLGLLGLLGLSLRKRLAA